MAVKVREKIKGSGEWWIFIDHHGKRKAKKIGNDKRLAKEVAKQIEAKLVLGYLELLDKPLSAFADYAGRWIATIVPASCTHATYIGYDGILRNHILPCFGEQNISDITRLQVKEFLMKKYRDGYAQSTVTHIKNAFGGIFGIAIDDEVISINPAHNLGRLYGKKTPKSSNNINFLLKEELSSLLETIQEHFPRYYPMALTLARTGMRLGEAIGLQWNDINFDDRLITVQRNLTKGKLETPKSGKFRHVDMSIQLTETLWRLKRNRERGMSNKVPVWIFLSESGNPVNETHWRRRIFNPALGLAGIKRIRTHDLRHTYASLLLQDGASMVYVKEQLGHSSIKVTVDIYGHLVPGGNKEAVDKLDDSPKTATIRNLSATKPTKKTQAIKSKSL